MKTFIYLKKPVMGSSLLGFTLTDKQAAQLAHDVFDLEAKRLTLKRTWFRRFSKVIPGKKAAQFFQLENQLNAALDLRVAAELPLIK